MKKPTRLLAIATASVCGVVLAVGGAYAASGSLSAADAPGQILKIDGVGPAAAHASENAKLHANDNARGIFGGSATTDSTVESDSADSDSTGSEDTKANVHSEIKANNSAKTEHSTSASTEPVEPVAPEIASQDASEVKGSETGKKISAWAHAKAGIETVAPSDAISLDANAGASASRSR